MSRFMGTSICFALLTIAFGGPSQSQAPVPPPLFATSKVEGTENVYIFHYQGYQSMFVVTSAGVIATDPIGRRRPEAVKTYIEEIQKITKAPIKYVIYSHHYWDHIAGGKPFKDLGATFVAHRNAKARLEAVKNPDVVMPTVWVDKQMNIRLGGTTLELNYVGRNHSDNSLVMRLPNEKIIFAVDFIPLQALPFRDMMDNWPLEMEESIAKVIAMDWDRIIPGHPGRGGRQIGTKDDARAQLGYLQDISAEVKKAASEGKCYDTAMKEIKLPKYESWGGYGAYLPGNIERYCELWGRGI